MIIELVGPSGSGKSTLHHQLYIHLSKGSRIVYRIGHGADFQHPQINSFISNISRHCIKTDLLLFPHFAQAFIKYPRLVCSVFIAVFSCRIHFMSVLRSVYRKIAFTILLRSLSTSNCLFLVDEGLLHSVNNLFIPYSDQLPKKAIADYLNLIPLPDLTIVLESSLGSLYERLIQRGDWSPRVKDEKELLQFLIQSRILFQFVSQHLDSRSSVLTFDTSCMTSYSICTHVQAFIDSSIDI